MTRLVSGVVMAAAVLAAIVWLPPIALRILACVVAGFAALEYLRVVGGHESQVITVGILTWFVAGGSMTMLAAVPVTVLLIGGVNSLYPKHSGRQAILSAFAILYISVPLGMLAALNARLGWQVTVLLIATVVVSDSLQFYSGRMFGRHALAPTISPKKTIEGAIGGVVAGTLFMALAGPYAIPKPPASLAALGFVMVLLGIAGDLFESKLKREANVKDSSALIPGHGGVLDRIDALLFVTPVFVFALDALS